MAKKFSNVLGIILGLFIVFALSSCDNFFSTSWGKEREYDASKIKLSTNNLDSWKEKAVGNPKLAKALVEKILSELPGKSGPEKAKFQKVGIELAVEQAGIGTKMIELAGSALSDIDSEDGVKNLLAKVQSGLSDVDKAAGNIAAIVKASALVGTGAGQAPTFDLTDPYAAAASPSDVGMAVMVLALSVIPNIDGNTDLSDLSGLTNLEIDDGSVKVKSGTTATPEEIALAAYLNLIASDTTGKYDNNLITSSIRDAFGLN
jgi:hypothetical protein